MSTYEALRFLGLDHYATASDIKAAYRRRASAIRPEPVIGTVTKLGREAEERMQALDRAYAALHHRVDHTSPDVDPLQSVEAGAKATFLAARFHTQWNRNLASEWVSQLEFARVGRVAAVVVVMALVGYGIVRGSAAKYPTLSVVNAKTVSVPRAEPLPTVRTERVVEKAMPAPEKKSPVATAELRPLRAPKLPSVDAEEAKEIDAACLAETGSKEGAFQACVVRTARETPHAIHLD
jgi:hypothetical protein